MGREKIFAGVVASILHWISSCLGVLLFAVSDHSQSWKSGDYSHIWFSFICPVINIVSWLFNFWDQLLKWKAASLSWTKTIQRHGSWNALKNFFPIPQHSLLLKALAHVKMNLQHFSFHGVLATDRCKDTMSLGKSGECLLLFSIWPLFFMRQAGWKVQNCRGKSFMYCFVQMLNTEKITSFLFVYALDSL